MRRSLLLILSLILIGSYSFCTHNKEHDDAPFTGSEMEPIVIGDRPLFKDFMGINGHFTFKPELYNQVCRLVRNYHNMNWDVNKPGDHYQPPYAVNGVNWKDHVYGYWKANGFETDICLQLSSFSANNDNYKQLWKGREEWSYAYGKALASYFGPSGNEKLATSMEIGNEPGIKFDATLYKAIFKNMAQGIRDGDSKIKILTPYVTVSTPDDYSQDLKGIYSDKDILPLYDVINLHSYAAVQPDEGPFNRSYPEDPTINYLKDIDKTIHWRNENAPDKEIWITEFGYDACTPEAMKNRSGWGLKLDWQGNTDEQQAQYLVRSYLAFAERGIQRAYLYFYNDDDEPFFHSSSGITRHFEPKVSFWALKQLYETLGDYRLKQIVKKVENDIYIYEFEHGYDSDRLIWVAWSPTGTKTHKKDGYEPRVVKATLIGLPGLPINVIGMATSKNEAPKPEWQQAEGMAITLSISESPTYIAFNKKKK